MSEFKQKRKTNLPERLRNDYILEGDAAKVFNKISDKYPSCGIEEVQNTLNELNDELEKLSIEAKKENSHDLLTQLESMNLKKRQMYGGMMTGMSATALIMYLMADALKEGANYVYKQINKLLEGGLKVMEFLSNKDGCAELILREYLGKKLMLFIQFYYIGDMVKEVANPMNVIVELVALLPKLLPYVTKGISAGFIGAIGYLVYHFANHYGTKLTENAKVTVDSLKTALDALEQAKSEDVVTTVISKSEEMVNKTKEVVNKTKAVVAELNKETPVLSEEEKQNFLTKIKENLTAITENRTGEFDDTMTMEQLRELDIAQEGGKKHKKRKTQKRKKNKSTKKTAKKSDKSKKYRK